MDALKKIGLLLLGYYDKLILGILLLVLAGVMIHQTFSMRRTIDTIGGLGGGLELKDKPIPVLEEEQFDTQIKLTREDLWQDGMQPTLEGADKLPVSVEMRQYIMAKGEGSLFDPPVYMYSSNSDRSLVHYTTQFNPETRSQESDGGMKIDTGGEEITIEEPNENALITYVYLNSQRQTPLPLILQNVTRVNPMDQSTWDFQFDIYSGRSKRSHMVKIGDTIPDSGGFVLKGVTMQQADPNAPAQQKPVATIQREEEDEVEVPLRERVSHGRTIFTLITLPPDYSRPQTFNAVLNQPFAVRMMINSQPRTEQYELISADSALIARKLADPANPKDYDGKNFEVKALTDAVKREYMLNKQER